MVWFSVRRYAGPAKEFHASREHANQNIVVLLGGYGRVTINQQIRGKGGTNLKAAQERGQWRELKMS